MPLKSLFVAPSLIAAGSAVFIAIPSLAGAEPAEPSGGGQSPGQTVQELKSQGYNVQIQWVQGEPDVVPLSQCVVTNVNTDAAPKAYVSVSCPAAGSQ